MKNRGPRRLARASAFSLSCRTYPAKTQRANSVMRIRKTSCAIGFCHPEPKAKDLAPE